MLIETLDIRHQLLGGEHPSTLASMSNLIELYEVWGKAEKAKQWRAKLPRKGDIKEQQ